MVYDSEAVCPPFPHQCVWYPYHSPFDPCPPIRKKTYVLTPNLFLGFQPPNLPQFPVNSAIYHGTLWPILFSPYRGRGKRKGECS